MNNLRAALAQIAPKLGDLEANLALHLAAIDRAGRDGADLVVFPELSLTGYLLWDQVPDVAIRGAEALPGPILDASRKTDLVVGFVEESPGHRFHNSAAYLSGGEVLHVHRKLFLPNYGMFEEARDFAPGDRLRVFETPHGPAGLLVCEDLWHPTCPWLLAHEGAEMIVVLSAGPTRGAKPSGQITSISVWRELLQVTARFQTTFVVYVNRVGCEDGLSFGGGSMVVDPLGRAVAELPALDEAVASVDLEAEMLRRARTAYPLLRDEDLELVHRELGRIRRQRYGLPADAPDDGAAAGAVPPPENDP